MLARNEGSLDRVVRTTLGVALLATVVVGPRSLYALIGIVPLLTVPVGDCPFYHLLGLRTCPAQ